MKMTVFWVVVPCSLVEVIDVSEVLSASIIRAIAFQEPFRKSFDWPGKVERKQYNTNSFANLLT
jgi:hypothetical protein